MLACSSPCDRVPTTRARSPRDRLVLLPAVDQALITDVLGSATGEPLAGTVAVWDRLAVFSVIVTETVRSVPATWTVTVCGW
jgi:hypothetical protein